MDKFVFITGITGIVFLFISLFILIHAIVKVAKRKMKIKWFITLNLYLLLILLTE